MNIVNYAAVMGIETDNHIDTNQFSYLALAFYVTFLFFELPNGWMMQHFPVAKYLGINGRSTVLLRSAGTVRSRINFDNSYALGDLRHSQLRRQELRIATGSSSLARSF